LTNRERHQKEVAEYNYKKNR